MAQRIPDVLLIMSDQHRGDCLSRLGHPGVRTPTLDALAQRGTLFRRAYTTVASCIPARYGLLSGLCPNTSGVVGFAAKPFETPTLPRMLAEVGYTTALVGRSMHQPPESGTCGYQHQVLGSTYVADDDYDRALKEAAPHVAGIRELVAEMGLSYNGWEAKPWPLDDKLHPTEWIVDRSQRLVDEVASDRSLFLTTSFYAPHPPLFPPRRCFDACAARPLPVPVMGDWVDVEKLTEQGDEQGHRVLLSGRTRRDAQAGYFGLIDHIDAAIARLIHAFRQRSERAQRPWLIVFTSDHGEMLGDHGYYRKCQPYEGSANIPLIIAGSPDLNLTHDASHTDPVCLEDLMPTLLDLAGAAIPDRLDGISLAPRLRGEDAPRRPWLHFEHAPCYSPAQAYHALTDGRFKYIWRPHDGSEQLFDLDEDPHEIHDLGGDSAANQTLAACRQHLVARLSRRPEGFVDRGQLIPGRPYPPLNDCRPV